MCPHLTIYVTSALQGTVVPSHQEAQSHDAAGCGLGGSAPGERGLKRYQPEPGAKKSPRND